MRKQLFLIFSIFVSVPVFAQVRTVSIQIRDSVTRKYISNVSYVIAEDDKTLLSGKSDTSGLIVCAIDPSKRMRITITSVGYDTSTMPLDGTTSQLYLKPGNILLHEVTVTTPREIEFKPGKIIVNVTNNIKAGANNVLELLRNVPTLSVNTDDGTIFLKGKPGVTILLDGKPITADLLKVLKPDAVKQIQLLSSASAKYSAEYKNGVINLVSNKRDIEGYEIVADILAGNRSRLYVSPSVNIQSGKLSTNFDVAYDRRQLVTDQSDNIEFKNSATSEQQRIDNHQHYIALDFIGTYEFNPRHVLSLSVNYFGYTFNKTIRDSYKRTSKIDFANDYLLYNSTNLTTKGGLNASLDYDYMFANKADGELIISGLISNSYSSQNTVVSDPDTGLVLRSHNKPVDKEYTLQADYTKPLSGHATLESGVKYIRRENNSDYSSVAFSNEGNTFDLISQKGIFSYSQNILGLYSQASLDLKQYSLGVGVRYELYSYDYDKTVSTSAGSFFPDLSLTRRFNKDYFLSFEYSNKIRRPGATFLTTFVDQSELNNNTQGNTDLKNEFLKDFSLGANLPFKTFPIFVNLDYDFYNNGISDYVYYVQADNGSEATLSTFVNLKHHRDFTISATARIVGIKSVRSNLNISFTASTFDFNGIHRAGNEFSVGESTGFSLKNGFRINTSATYRSNFLLLQGTSAGYTITSLSFTKHFTKPDLLIGVGADNFSNLGYPVTTSLAGPNFDHVTVATTFRDIYYLKLSYSLTKNSVKPTHQTKISNSDLKK